MSKNLEDVFWLIQYCVSDAVLGNRSLFHGHFARS